MYCDLKIEKFCLCRMKRERSYNFHTQTNTPSHQLHPFPAPGHLSYLFPPLLKQDFSWTAASSTWGLIYLSSLSSNIASPTTPSHTDSRDSSVILFFLFLGALYSLTLDPLSLPQSFYLKATEKRMETEGIRD